MTKQFTFSKEERLTLKNDIEALFNEGQSFNMPPFKLFFMPSDPMPLPSIKTVMAVPKRRFKKATDRNRIRRLIREAYRLNKHRIKNRDFMSTISLNIGIVYIGSKADISFVEIEKAMIGCLEKLAGRFEV